MRMLTALLLICFSLISYADEKNPDEKLFIGAAKGDIWLVNQAIREGANVNTAFLGNPAIYHAASEGHNEVIKILLANGAKINAKTAVAGRTALHEAALRGRTSTVKLLIENGADVNARNRHNRTPLYYVTTPPLPLKLPSNHREIAEILRQHGGRQ